GHTGWVARFDDRQHRDDAGRDVVVAPDDSAVFVTGKAGRHDQTLSYDAQTATQRWAVGNRRGAIEPLGTEAIAPDGGTLFAAGGGTIVAYQTDSGSRSWIRSRPTQDVLAQAIAIGPDGSSVYLTGSLDRGFNRHLVVVARSAATGVFEWSAKM